MKTDKDTLKNLKDSLLALVKDIDNLSEAAVYEKLLKPFMFAGEAPIECLTRLLKSIESLQKPQLQSDAMDMKAVASTNSINGIVLKPLSVATSYITSGYLPPYIPPYQISNSTPPGSPQHVPPMYVVSYIPTYDRMDQPAIVYSESNTCITALHRHTPGCTVGWLRSTKTASSQ